MKAAFHAVLESSDDAMTINGPNEVPHHAKNTVACVSSASALQTAEDVDSPLQPVTATKPSCAKPPCRRPFKLQVLKKKTRHDEVTPATKPKTPPTTTVSSSLGESILSATLFKSQEYMCCATPSVPSTRFEAMAFISWKSTSQDAPAINWEQAMSSQQSARVNCGNRKDTALHQALQLLLNSQQSGNSEQNVMQSVNDEEHVMMHRSCKSSDGQRIASSLFMTRTTAAVSDTCPTEGAQGTSNHPTQEVIFFDEITSYKKDNAIDPSNQ